MKQFACVATIAIIAHAGAAWAQPVTIGPGEGPDRSERPAREAPGRSIDSERGPAQRIESPAIERRETQSGQDPQRGQGQRRERDQAQRERPDQAPSPRVRQEDRRDEPQQRNQARERQDERNGRRPVEQAQPDNRAPRTPETAQPQRQDNRPASPSTAQPAPRQDDQQRPATNAQRPDATQPGATSPQPAQNRASPSGQNSDNAQASAADNQRIADTVRQRVERNEIRPVQNLGVSVSVGAELPSRVQLQALPSEIVAMRPQYRDYRYTVSEREIVIVDPRSRRIVEVIDRAGGRNGSIDVYATFEGQPGLRRWHRPDTVVFREGVVLPAGVPYQELPDELIERHPNWRGYQYVMTESDEVAIVEPRTRRIVEVVDKSTARSAAAPSGSAGGSPPSAGPTDRHELARMIMAEARPGEIQGLDGLKGAVLPTQVALRPLPAEVEQQDQQLRGYQYALIGDDVLIVDPRSRQIIDVIE